MSVPEDQGIDSEQLGAIFDAVQTRHLPIHSLLVIRNGYAVLDADFYPYSKNTLHDLASMTKSVVATLAGIAIDRGYLTTSQRVLEFFPGRAFANTDERKRRLTVEHLLTMTSGFCTDRTRGEEQLAEQRASPDWVQLVLDRPLVSEPGARFAYCSEASNLMSAILTQATGMNAEAFARRYLYEPLSISRVIWPRDPQGNSHGWGDTYMRPMDMAKLGYLYLQNGVWNGQQIISRDFIGQATRAHVAASPSDGYGYKWWTTGPPARFEARGRGGQTLVVIPSLQTVIVMTGTAGFEPGDIGAPLLSALQSNRPLPRNTTAYEGLTRKVAIARQPPARAPLAPLPSRARAVSGRTFTVSANPYGLKTVRLTFSDDGARGAIDYSYYEPMNRHGATLESPFRLDGVYAMSNTSLIHNLPTGARGGWSTSEVFDLELNMAGFNHILRFVFDFATSPHTVQLIDETQFRATLTLAIAD